MQNGAAELFIGRRKTDILTAFQCIGPQLYILCREIAIDIAFKDPTQVKRVKMHQINGTIPGVFLYAGSQD